MRCIRLLIVAFASMLCADSALASLIHFTDKVEWESAVGNFTTITFTEFPQPTQITDHYSDLGIFFTSLNFIHGTCSFVNDCFGLHGPDGIRFTFDTPQNWVAVDYPGAVQFQLFLQGDLIETSELFLTPGTGHFAGLISMHSFDEVFIFRPEDFAPAVFIDDLHWGAIPAPGALPLLALVAFASRRRRGR